MERKASMGRPKFRFEDLEIWKDARELAIRFHEVAEGLDKRRLYRYAEQLRAAGLSLTNNIAEPSRREDRQRPDSVGESVTAP